MTLQNRKMILTLTVIATIVAATMLIQTAYAAPCPNGKCYAVHSFYPSSTKQVLGSQSTHKVFQNLVNNGGVFAPLWSYTTNVPPVLLEIGWRDLAGSSTTAKFYCAVGGTIQGQPWGSPTHNTFYTFQIDDINQDGTWVMAAGGQSCSHTISGTAKKLNNLKVGYEITYDNNSISTNEFKDLKGYRNSQWILWSSADGTRSVEQLPSRPPMFVNLCDSGSWSRIQAGMLSSPLSSCS